jgi:hypothetical protein
MGIRVGMACVAPIGRTVQRNRHRLEPMTRSGFEYLLRKHVHTAAKQRARLGGRPFYSANRTYETPAIQDVPITVSQLRRFRPLRRPRSN